MLDHETLDADYVLDTMSASNSNLNILILDACRNSPFRSFSRSMKEGLAEMKEADGAIIAYSTSKDKVALDGEAGGNSPYTKSLVKWIGSSEPIEQVLKKVREDVSNETNGEQKPWYYASITGDFYFNPKAGAATDSEVSAPPPVKQEPEETVADNAEPPAVQDAAANDAARSDDQADDAWVNTLIAWADEFLLREEDFPRNREALLALTELDLNRANKNEQLPAISYLPPEIGQLHQLQLLNLEKNELSSLPAEIGQLQQLQKLFLGKNQLKSLPPEIGQLQ